MGTQAGTGADPAFIERLRGICGPGQVFDEPATLATYRSDAMARRRRLPAVAVLPGNGEEVRAVVRACHEARVPWVARGAGTGLSGGALPHPGGVLIVLTRLRRIVSVNLADAEVIVEPGVSPLAVSRAVAPTHFYPPDPATEAVCTIGGTVAENAAGPHSFKYGSTASYVNGLDVVLTDGTLVELRRDRPGYDLLGAFIGSEGTLGIAVRIHLRVLPAPESVRTMVAFFDSTVQAGDAVSRVVARGLAPSALELMDAMSLRAAEEAAGGGYRQDAGAALLVEFDGPREACIANLEAVLSVCSRAGARDVRVAADAQERAELWRTRLVAFPALRRLASAYDVQDAVIPRTRLAAVLEKIASLSAEYGLPVANVFSAGDGNLHPIVCFAAGSETEQARARELSTRLLKVCVDAGGSLTGEHGIGVDKLGLMNTMFAPQDLAAFRHLRDSFDPSGLVNPGKLLDSGGLGATAVGSGGPGGAAA